jgi:hypothetical protein
MQGTAIAPKLRGRKRAAAMTTGSLLIVALSGASDAGVVPRSQITASLTRPGGASSFVIHGSETHLGEFRVVSDALRLPCNGRGYVFKTVTANLGDGTTRTYHAEARLSRIRTRGARVGCNRAVPADLGSRGLSIDVRGSEKHTLNRRLDLHAVRMQGGSLTGTMFLKNELCSGRYRLTIQLQGPQRSLVVKYRMRLDGANIDGSSVPCG